MKPTRTIAFVAAAVAAASLAISAPAFADGKGNGGCASGGWTLAYYLPSTHGLPAPANAVPGDLVIVGSSPLAYEPLTHAGLTVIVSDGMTQFQLDGIDAAAIFKMVDKNGDGDICFKLPDGWTQGPANKTDLLSLTDNKVLS